MSKSQDDKSSEQMFFAFAEEPADLRHRALFQEDTTEFESEDDALLALIDTKNTASDDEWIPCDPNDASDCIASKWLESRSDAPENAVPEASSVSGASAALPSAVPEPALPGNSSGILLDDPLPVSAPASPAAAMTEQEKNGTLQNPVALENNSENASALACTLPEESAAPAIPVEKPHLPRVRTAGKSFPALTEIQMKRIALSFLYSQSPRPTAFATDVLSVLPRLRHAAASFTLDSVRKPASRLSHSVIVELCTDREKCRVDSLARAALLSELNAENEALKKLEAQIRESEPQLKNDSLFAEAREWDYRSSKNRSYHACLRRIAKLDRSLHLGNRFDRFLYERLANEYYLLVPEGLISPDELCSDWGLLSVNPATYRIRVLRTALRQDADPEKSNTLALRIAAASMENVLTAKGLSFAEDGTARFHPLPKRRRPYQCGDPADDSPAQ